MPAPAPPQPPPNSVTDAFLYGAKTAATSVFMFVITVTYVGFGALTHDYGLTLLWAMLSTVVLWAGPAQVILATALGSGTSVIEAALAVGLSSVRLMPMVVSLLPLVKPERPRAWQLLVPVHFMAVSVWVEAMRLAPGMARELRLSFCNGVGCALMTAGVVATAVGYYLSAALPALFGAAAMFITPMSFLVSTARNSQLFMERAALALGLTIGPALAYGRVSLDLLWTGVIAGTLAYALARWRRRTS
ncbi:MAG TPA: AzlC family ABC transporter permease [Xanthobacteraceae bacterium]|nr:AzlC family ABC transporter permease [Xanthobacteraceae bacterium]